MRLRKGLASSLEREMPYLVAIQQRCRTPALDVYFVKTSLFGSHTFFMIFIPTFFWYGYSDIGRGLLYILAAGGYLTSVLKDLFCIARPFSPPLARLSVGNHHHEYGFPSTHSTNSVSMALYFSSLVMRYTTQPAWFNAVVYAFFAGFALTVTFGRLYTGMHSMVDVSVGSLIGVIVWAAYHYLEATIEAFTLSSAWTVTSTVLPATLFLVFVHPAPAEDCPCFEDAVAFVSVVCGIMVGRTWCHEDFFQATIGSRGSSALSSSVWSAAVFAKLVVGILSIFVWRLVAKEVAHAVLPPLFRLFHKFLLPRRHYVVATEYDAYKKTDGLHPIPSILDLPSLDDDDSDSIASGDSTAASSPNLGVSQDLRNRNGSGSGSEEVGERKRERRERNGGEQVRRKVVVEDPIRRDADVLTKVCVYSGIGWIATITVPRFFSWVGLSV
ncbi:hypothetical protein MNV49_001546 [Pseudohyphozyma bogoriensis]|nr:hypothetical protein MNV49_001546 [Pseudohyphozyma bogoriensis]